jgi:hypothetical protein
MNYPTFFLLILISICTGCQPNVVDPPKSNWRTTEAYCKACIDSCQIISNKKSDLAPLFFDKNLLLSFNQKTLLDTVVYNQEAKFSAQNDSLLFTRLFFSSREGWIQFDTIYEHLIYKYSDKINVLDRKMYAVPEMARNKIQISFAHYNPTVYYQKDTLRKRGIIEGVINKNLITNQVEEIRILIDSIEYVLDASNLKQAIRQ